MFRCYWMVLILCFGAIASAQSNPERDKLLTEAQAAYKDNDYEKTKELAARILAQNPKDHAALYMRASARVDHAAARARINPEPASVEKDLKELREGIEDAREALKIGGGAEVNYYLPYLYGMISLANIEGKKDHATTAVDVAKSVLGRTNLPALTPEQRANILYQRASAYMFLKDMASAIADYQEAIKTFPALMGSYINLAQCYNFSGQYDKALATFSAAVEKFPDNPLVFNNRGVFLQQQGKIQESLPDFNKSIELDKTFINAYANRGYSNQLLGNLQIAEADFTKALAINPNFPLVYSLRGTVRLSLGNAKGAIEDYSQALRIVPQQPVANADLGFAKFFSRDFDGANVAFEKSVQIDAMAMRYLSPWRVWSLVLSGKPDAVDEIASVSINKAEKDRDWIDEQVLFLNGKVSEKDFVEFANKTTDEKLKNAQLCEAYFFIAERRSQANDKANATAFYTEVLKKKEPQLSAYRGAQFALQTFGK